MYFLIFKVFDSTHFLGLCPYMFYIKKHKTYSFLQTVSFIDLSTNHALT